MNVNQYCQWSLLSLSVSLSLNNIYFINECRYFFSVFHFILWYKEIKMETTTDTALIFILVIWHLWIFNFNFKQMNIMKMIKLCFHFSPFDICSLLFFFLLSPSVFTISSTLLSLSLIQSWENNEMVLFQH